MKIKIKNKKKRIKNIFFERKFYEIKSRNREIIDKNIKDIEYFPKNLNAESF